MSDDLATLRSRVRTEQDAWLDEPANVVAEWLSLLLQIPVPPVRLDHTQERRGLDALGLDVPRSQEDSTAVVARSLREEMGGLGRTLGAVGAEVPEADLAAALQQQARVALDRSPPDVTAARDLLARLKLAVDVVKQVAEELLDRRADLNEGTLTLSPPVETEAEDKAALEALANTRKAATEKLEGGVPSAKRLDEVERLILDYRGAAERLSQTIAQRLARRSADLLRQGTEAMDALAKYAATDPAMMAGVNTAFATLKATAGAAPPTLRSTSEAKTALDVLLPTVKTLEKQVRGLSNTREQSRDTFAKADPKDLPADAPWAALARAKIEAAKSAPEQALNAPLSVANNQEAARHVAAFTEVTEPTRWALTIWSKMPAQLQAGELADKLNHDERDEADKLHQQVVNGLGEFTTASCGRAQAALEGLVALAERARTSVTLFESKMATRNAEWEACQREYDRLVNEFKSKRESTFGT